MIVFILCRVNSYLKTTKTMKKANVNLFDKDKVQVKLLKNKNLRISDGRKNPTRVVNLRKTGITIWTDGEHLRIFRGNLLKEVIGRSVYRTNKFQTVEFIASGSDVLERRSITNLTNSFIGMSNIQEGLIVNSTSNFIGMSNIQEGRSTIENGTASFIGMSNIQEGRSANAEEDLLIIGGKDASEARTLENYAVYISLTDKSVTVRHGNV